MGKGKRNGLRRDEEKLQSPDKNLNKQKTGKKKSKSDIWIAVACIAFAVIIAGVLIGTVLSENGVFLRAKTAVEAEEVEVNGAMMSFFLNDYILNWYNAYSMYVSYGLFSLDMTKDFREQPFGGANDALLGTFDDVSTWFDYFFHCAYEGDSQMGTLGVKQYITYANAAKKAGLSLDDQDKAEIEEILTGLDATLDASGVKYSDWYGKGVKKSDARKCYELIFLAEKFVEKKTEELKAELDKDTELVSITKYIEDNKSAFYTADYLTYKIEISGKGKTDKEFNDTVALTKIEAEKLQAANTPEEFIQLIKDYEASVKGETAEELTPEEIESEIEKNEKELSYPAETGDELADWMFDEEREKEDATFFEETKTVTEKETEKETEEETETTSDTEASSDTETGSDVASAEEESEETPVNDKEYQVYTVNVYFVTRTSHLDDSKTMDYAFLASNDEDAIKEVLLDFKTGELTSERFVELAQKKYDAIHGSEEHEHSDDELFEFNAIEKGVPGFNTEYAVLNAWLKDEARTDKELSEIFKVTVENKDYYAVVFFENYNVEKWEADGYNGVLNERFEAWYEAESAKVVVHFDAIDDLETIKMYSGTASDGHIH